MAHLQHLGLVLFLGLWSLWPGQNALAQPCLVAYDLTVNPPPVNGQYQCGQVVTFCLTISDWNTTSANWLHGIVPGLGPGWDASTLTPVSAAATQGGSGGTWNWFPDCTGTAGTAIPTTGPGFFFDLDNDGVPGNNFGDFVNGPCNFQFCWSVAVASGAACVNGLDLSMTANVYGDSETGSWGASGCNGDINPVLNATVQACQADAGLPGSLSVCEDMASFDLFAQLGGTPDAGGTWTDPAGNPVSGIVDPSAAPGGTYTYTVFDAIATCPPVSATVQVTIATNVDAGLANALTLCEDAGVLDMFAALGGTPTSGGTWAAPNGTPWGGSFTAAVDPQGSYSYTVVPAAPCLAQTTTLTLAVDPAPWAGDDASLTKCANQGSMDLFPLLTSNPDVGGGWLDPLLAPHDGIIHTATSLSGTYAYVVPGSGACTHLIDTGFVRVTINPLPRVAFVAEPDSGCHPLRVTLFNTTPAEDVGATCQWDLGDGDVAAACDQVEHLYMDPGWYPVRLTVTSPAGCTNFLLDHHAILVEEAPQATFLTSPDPGTVGNSTLFFSALDLDNSYYGWTLDGVALSTGPNAQQWFTDVLGSTHDICLDVADRYGCVDTLCQEVSIVVPSIFYPNAFTPDGDGLNDKYMPRVLDVVAKEHLFQVFDRWGEVIFTTTDPTEGWDGSLGGGGSILPQGVYVWRLETLPMYAAEKVEVFGSVTLIK